MKISRTDAFKKDYQELSDNIKKSANKQIIQLLMDHNHPSLNLEKLHGLKNVYSIRVNIQYRISLSFNEEEVILRRVLNHDDLYKNP
jgi:plasmid maintenance system killer protein